MTRGSLFIDSTGGIVSKFDKNSKRVFLYSIVLHVKSDNNWTRLETGTNKLLLENV